MRQRETFELGREQINEINSFKRELFLSGENRTLPKNISEKETLVTWYDLDNAPNCSLNEYYGVLLQDSLNDNHSHKKECIFDFRGFINPETSTETQETASESLKNFNRVYLRTKDLLKKEGLKYPSILDSSLEEIDSIAKLNLFLQMTKAPKEADYKKQLDSENCFNFLKTLLILNDIEKTNYHEVYKNAKMVVKNIFSEQLNLSHDGKHGSLEFEGKTIEFEVAYRAKEENVLMFKIYSRPHSSMADIEDIVGLRFLTKNKEEGVLLSKYIKEQLSGSQACSNPDLEDINFSTKKERVFKSKSKENSSSSSSYEAIHINSRLDSKVLEMSGNPIPFEIQIAEIDNKNDFALSHHAYYKLKIKLSALSRQKSITHDFLDKELRLVANNIYKDLSEADKDNVDDNTAINSLKEFLWKTLKSEYLTEFQVESHSAKNQLTLYKVRDQILRLPFALLRAEEKHALTRNMSLEATHESFVNDSESMFYENRELIKVYIEEQKARIREGIDRILSLLDSDANQEIMQSVEILQEVTHELGELATIKEETQLRLKSDKTLEQENEFISDEIEKINKDIESKIKDKLTPLPLPDKLKSKDKESEQAA